MNDCHNHITYTETLFAPNYTFDAFLRDKSPLIKNHVVFLNPIHKNLYNCKPGHRLAVIDLPDEQNLAFACGHCYNITYTGKDPYRKDNEQLLADCSIFEDLHPYIYLTLSNNTINEEFEYFEHNHKGEFCGIKVHPNLCSRKLSEINFNSNYPMIVHTGFSEFDHPADVAKFAEHYDGNILFSHFARCDIETLKKIATLDNAYIDVSPLYLAADIVNQNKNGRYFESPLTSITDITEFFKKLISIVGEDKIIFGSDSPWGTQKDVEILYHSLNLPKETKDKIFKTNFENFNKIKTMKKPPQTSQSDKHGPTL